MSTSLKFNQPESELKIGGGLIRPDEMVVQCPACLTSFGIERSVVAAVLAPRFHCSKCDHTFGLKDKADTLGQPRSAYAPPELSSVSRGTDRVGASMTGGRVSQPASFEWSPHSAPAQQGMPSAFDSDIAEGVVAVYRNKARIDAAPHQQKDSGSKLDIPKRWDGTMRATEPRETAPASVASLPHNELRGELMAEDRSSAPTAQLGLNLRAASHNRHDSRRIGAAHSIRSGDSNPDSPELINIESFGTVENAPLRDTEDALGGAFGGNTAYAAAFAEQIDPVDLPVSTFGQRRNPLSPLRPAPAASFTKNLVAPILACIGLLLIASLVLKGNRTLSESFIKAALPGALQAAPPELYIKNSRFQKVTLDNGEVVRIISGTLVNGGQSNFYGVQVEAVAFDRFGRPLGTIRADASSSLAKSKVQSLTTEMIQQLQKSSGAKQLIIKPGQQREFAVALIGEQFAPTHHFGARVFTAKSF